MNYIFTGTGRCGTGFISRLMHSAGYKCTHEGVFNLEGWDSALEKIELRRKNPWWGWEGDSSWLAAPYLDRMELQGIKIVHLIRNPCDVIKSMLRMGFFTLGMYNPYVQYGYVHAESLKQYTDSLQSAAAWYVAYNAMIEPYAHFTHRIEDDPRNLLDALGLDYAEKRLFDDVYFNHRDVYGPIDVDLNDLPLELLDQLKEMTIRYGYEYSWASRGLGVDSATVSLSAYERLNAWLNRLYEKLTS